MEGNFTFTGDFSTAAIAAVLSVEMILALIANGIVLLITITQRKSWKQSSTIFFTSLILAHLVMNILYLPFTIIAFAAGEWFFGETNKEKTATCFFAAFIFWYCILIILMTLAAISFDRFLFIVKPHLHKWFMRPWVALTVTVIIWLMAALCSATPFFGLGDFAYHIRVGSCIPVWITLSFKAYTLVLVAVLLSIIIITSVWTFCFTRRFINELSNSNVYANKKKRLFGIFGAMSLVYIVCFLPSVIMLVLFSFVVIVPQEYNVTCFVCLLFVTIANPIVQSCFRPEVKGALHSLYQRMSGYANSLRETMFSVHS